MDREDRRGELRDFDDDEGEEETPQTTLTNDKSLEKQFRDGRLRVVQDRNDFFLPHVLDFINGRQWGNLRPEYQRRLRWSVAKKSRLIESFLMNVPVPPVFLYDAESKLEVLDGQQRINSIVEFLDDKFGLDKLTIWQALNGRKYSELPPVLKRGLDRAKLSAITLLAEASKEGKDQIDLRSQIFDRLNTGGEKLNPQELRNCLYAGPFNNLIVELSGLRSFTDAWEIPSRLEHTLSDGSYDEELQNNKLFSTMGDCQIVLRFFAFLDEKYIAGSTRKILDDCMKRLRRIEQEEVDRLRKLFSETLDLALSIFGTRAFRIGGGEKGGRLSRPLFDAEMVAVSRLLGQSDKLISKRNDILAAVDSLTDESNSTYAIIVGRPNTALAIKTRIATVEKAIRDSVE